MKKNIRISERANRALLFVDSKPSISTILGYNALEFERNGLVACYYKILSTSLHNHDYNCASLGNKHVHCLQNYFTVGILVVIHTCNTAYTIIR